jgi:D-hexose-6-phosphate mutarotase
MSKHINETIGEGNLTKYILSNDSYACVEVYLLGANITRFKNSHGKEILFQNPKSNYEVEKPIRAGIPIM